MMVFIWLAALVAFAVVEIATVGLTSIWFAIGALASLIAAAAGGLLWLQLVLFIVVSGAALVFTRPLAKRFLNSRRKATNADRVLSMVGVVREDIDNVRATGVVSVGGKDWTARSLTGEPIPAGTYVRPMNIEGVKLIVVPAASGDAPREEPEMPEENTEEWRSNV